MQPFDRGPFDKRYRDVIKPAIKDADMEPYRVDQDPSTEILIESIEKEIRKSKACVAEITTDNPNVWYELGYAIALGKSVVLICSDERDSGFPFDIQHRDIITYSTDSSSDYEELASKITSKLNAVSNSDEDENLISVTDQYELNDLEVILLAVIVDNKLGGSWEGAFEWAIANDMESSGFTPVATSIGLRKLSKRGFIESTATENDRGEKKTLYSLTDRGYGWMIDNKDRFNLEIEDDEEAFEPDDELPF
jgi:nucleoside 2-deoxyribosyltransferase